MAQKKLFRFAQLKSFPNVWEYPTDMRGKWQSHFKNDHPIVLELACGRGEYTFGLAKLFPQKNFIGVDVKGNRMYLGAKQAIHENLNNAAFLRTQIEMITDYFESGEIAEIWITFPDPQLRTSKAKKRLTHPRFLRLYQQILQTNGFVHLKTDSPDLFHFTKLVLQRHALPILDASEDVYARLPVDKTLSIKTHYESLDIAQSKKIFYLKFLIPGELVNEDEALQEYLKQTEQNQP